LEEKSGLRRLLNHTEEQEGKPSERQLHRISPYLGGNVSCNFRTRDPDLRGNVMCVALPSFSCQSSPNRRFFGSSTAIEPRDLSCLFEVAIHIMCLNNAS
jgi:hypothetical protein